MERLNHGIGFDTAAIELLLPTYAESPAQRQDLQALGTEPASGIDPELKPVLSSRSIRSVRTRYGGNIAARRTFFTGTDGSCVPTRLLPNSGQYACDLFIGSTLQIDLAGNSSTATLGRIAGFGGAPNMGADARGRRHGTKAWLQAGYEALARSSSRRAMPRGRKLVVQMVETFREHMQPAFVERLDAGPSQNRPRCRFAGNDHGGTCTARC